MEKEPLAYSKREAQKGISWGRRSSGWGYSFVRNLAFAMTLFLIAGGASSADVSLFKVIADPGEILTATEHQGLTNPDTFSPRYRLEQLKISQPGNDTVISWQRTNYTSLFDKGFLHQLLDLQNAITKVAVLHGGSYITLQDICSAPLKPFNKNCAILSILNYNQNSDGRVDIEIFDEFGFWVMYNYLTHLKYCVVNPNSTSDPHFRSIPCLGDFGGPVYPDTIFDQYEGGRYSNATTFIITLLVDNYQDPVLNEPAEAWEAKFKEFIIEYINTHDNLHIDVSTGVGAPPETRYQTARADRGRHV